MEGGGEISIYTGKYGVKKVEPAAVAVATTNSLPIKMSSGENSACSLPEPREGD